MTSTCLGVSEHTAPVALPGELLPGMSTGPSCETDLGDDGGGVDGWHARVVLRRSWAACHSIVSCRPTGKVSVRAQQVHKHARYNTLKKIVHRTAYPSHTSTTFIQEMTIIEGDNGIWYEPPVLLDAFVGFVPSPLAGSVDWQASRLH